MRKRIEGENVWEQLQTLGSKLKLDDSVLDEIFDGIENQLGEDVVEEPNIAGYHFDEDDDELNIDFGHADLTFNVVSGKLN